MELHKLTVTKTARYFTAGNPTASKVYILLHGYGMLANAMIEKLQLEEDTDCFYIAPEGLSRFYWKGFDGNVVASWMTKEDRQDEINDYIKYLNLLFNEFDFSNKSINILGFSQGVATMSRWLIQTKFKIDKLIFWAGEPPADIDYTLIFNSVKKAYFVYGNLDVFINEIQLEIIKQRLKSVAIEYVSFEGKHELNQTLFQEIK